jgi:hypothetical protein
LANKEGRVESLVYTHWVRWVDGKQGREIRKASIINAQVLADFWHEVGEPYLIVNNAIGLLLFLRLGGNGLVAKEIAEKFLPDTVASGETAYDGPLGFKGINNLHNHVFKRACRPQQRMRVMKRDRHRCRICGRRPDDYTDIELHVNHIRPWGKGGLTEDSNLITLCDTCHDGLEPHEDHSLFHLLDPERWALNLNQLRTEFRDGVNRYREAIGEIFREIDKLDS